MSWRSFLASAAVMVGLHDSDVTPGPAAKRTRDPVKPDDTNAYWLDLGIRLIAFLQRKEEEDNEPMVSLAAFLDHVQADLSQVTLEDVRFVANRLSTPRTMLFTNSLGGQEIEQDTALLVRPPESLAAVRLSPTGRRAIGYAASIGDAQFADLDAIKMRRLVEDGSFDQARAACLELLSRLRGLGHQLTRAEERMGTDELRDHFGAARSRYRSAIEDTQTIAQETLETLTRYIDRSDTSYDFAPYLLQDGLHTLLTAVQRLSRHFLRFLTKLNESGGAEARRFRFDHLAAHWLVGEAPSPAMFDRIVGIAAPAKAAWPPLEPLTLAHTVEPQKETEPVSRVVLLPVQAGTDVANRLQSLLTAYKDVLERRLDAGPVSLLTLLSDELPWSPESLMEMSALLGATLHSKISLGGLELDIFPHAECREARAGGGTVVEGHDLTIRRRSADES